MLSAGNLTCDFNQDAACTVVDLDLLILEIVMQGSNPLYDLNGSGGPINLADRDAWLAAAGNAHLPSHNPYLVGDVNLDGTVNETDFGIWNINKFTASGKWSQADLNADGVTDGSDFSLWNQTRFLSSAAAGVVPEPSIPVMSWVVWAGLHFCRARRRRQVQEPPSS
jgi:hypothetical protein